MNVSIYNLAYTPSYHQSFTNKAFVIYNWLHSTLLAFWKVAQSRRTDDQRGSKNKKVVAWIAANTAKQCVYHAGICIQKRQAVSTNVVPIALVETANIVSQRDSRPSLLLLTSVVGSQTTNCRRHSKEYLLLINAVLHCWVLMSRREVCQPHNLSRGTC